MCKGIAFLMASLLIYSCKSAKIANGDAPKAPNSTEIVQIDSLPETIIEEIEVVEDTIPRMNSALLRKKTDSKSLRGNNDFFIYTDFSSTTTLVSSDFDFLSKYIAGAAKINYENLADLILAENSFLNNCNNPDASHLLRASNDMIPYLLARRAGIVFLHTPKDTRAIEGFNDRYCACSLDGFLPYDSFDSRDPHFVQANLRKDWSYSDGKIYSKRPAGSGMTMIDNDESAIFKLKELSHIDIPETKIDIDDNGNNNYLKQDF
jgi:hypothetical protein